MQVICSYRNEPKPAFSFEQRTYGTKRCHTHGRKRRMHEPTKRITRSTTRKLQKRAADITSHLRGEAPMPDYRRLRSHAWKEM